LPTAWTQFSFFSKNVWNSQPSYLRALSNISNSKINANRICRVFFRNKTYKRLPWYSSICKIIHKKIEQNHTRNFYCHKSQKNDPWPIANCDIFFSTLGIKIERNKEGKRDQKQKYIPLTTEKIDTSQSIKNAFRQLSETVSIPNSKLVYLSREYIKTKSQRLSLFIDMWFDSFFVRVSVWNIPCVLTRLQCHNMKWVIH